MTKPVRIQRRRTKGWRMPPNTIYVGRGSRFGNPYRVGMLGVPDNETAVRLFKRLLRRSKAYLSSTDNYFFFTKERIQLYLRGKNLACWCPPDKPCHADWLKTIANL